MVQSKLQSKNGSELEMLICQDLGGSKIAANGGECNPTVLMWVTYCCKMFKLNNMKWYNNFDFMVMLFLICSIAGCVSCYKINMDTEVELKKIESQKDSIN